MCGFESSKFVFSAKIMQTCWLFVFTYCTVNLCRLDSTADTCFTSWLGRTYSVVDTGGARNSLKIARAPNLFTIHVGDDS